MIRKFKEIKGKYIEKIYGQDRLAFAMSDNEDFYDLIAWSKRGGYQGALIYFYDFETGDVYQPFEKKKNVVYIRPEFADGFYYFLRGDYDENDCATEEYKYYHKVITKDFHGNLLSEEIGALHQAGDGTWWIS